MTHEELVIRVAALEAKVARLTPQAPVDLASDKYADFTVRKSPPKWTDNGGPDYSGQPISKTSPEFCEAIADFLDWQASRDEEKNYSYVNGKGVTVFPAPYARKDAARARAWAKRLRIAAATPVRPPARVQQRELVDIGDDDGGLPF